MDWQVENSKLWRLVFPIDSPIGIHTSNAFDVPLQISMPKRVYYDQPSTGKSTRRDNLYILWHEDVLKMTMIYAQICCIRHFESKR